MMDWKSKCAYAPCGKALKGWDNFLSDTHGPTGCCSEVCFLRQKLEQSQLQEERLKSEKAQVLEQFRNVIKELSLYEDCYDLVPGEPRRKARWIFLRCAYLAPSSIQPWANGAADVGSYYGEVWR